MNQLEARLTAVLSNPPVTDGARTLRRVELARELLGFPRVDIVNLFPLPSYRTGAISQLGIDQSAWLPARQALLDGLSRSSGVLLAFGTTEPSGPARQHFQSQVQWLRRHIQDTRLPTWQVGPAPRHPSRWQRLTYRTHPGVPFTEALRDSLILLDDVAAPAH